MVHIENITRREEDRKLKIKRTRELIDKFFGEVYIIDTPVSVSVCENELSDHFLSVNFALNKIKNY